jgi:Zn-dependent protease with chaperone function
MKRLPIVLLLAAGCTTNPYTGRSQFIAVSEAEEAQLGVQAYQEVLAQSNLSRDPLEVGPVLEVGRRLAAAANAPRFRWEFSVIVDDGTLNAWCLPGGKIAFYTGIYPALHDEAGMAFVMGHEIAHALLRHGAERMSENLLVGGLGALLAATLGGKDEKAQQTVLACYGAVAGIGFVLPHSRSHESEADRMGLELMARAGYDPRASVEVWKRMAALGGGGTPEFLSTHPSHETRIQDLERRMPEALAVYEGAPKAPVRPLVRIPGNRKGAGKKGGAALIARPAAAETVAVRPVGAKRGTLEDGRKAVTFEFSFSRDVYLESITLGGPQALTVRVDAKCGIPAEARRNALLFRLDKSGPEFVPGRYTASFSGSAGGETWAATLAYDVP